MERRVVLPIQDNPPIMSYNHHAAFLGILFTIKDFYKYFYSDFINIWCNDMNTKELSFNFLTEYWYDDDIFFDIFILINNSGTNFDNHFFESGFDENSLQLRSNNAIESIKAMINNGFYVSGYINEFYVPNRYSTGQVYNFHDYNIHGFNDETECFYIDGYTTNRKFETVEIKYSDYILGNTSLKEKSKTVFSKIKNQYQFQINPQKIALLLNDYLNADGGKLIYKRHFPKGYENSYFGIGVYDRLIDLFESQHIERLDLRIFLILKEHKQCMLKRFQVLKEVNINIENTICKRYKEILDKHSIMFNMAIKFNETKNESILTKIISTLNDVKIAEFKLLSLVYKVIMKAL